MDKLIRRRSLSSNAGSILSFLLLLGCFLGLFGSSIVAVEAVAEPVTENPNVYLFIRNVTSSNLTYLDARTSPLRSFAFSNTFCAQEPTGFFMPGNPLHSFLVIDKEDMLMQESTVLTYVPSDRAFLVFDSKEVDWYFWNDSSLHPLSNISAYNSSAWSAVCYIDSDVIPFIQLPELSVMIFLSYVVFLLACLGGLVALVAIIVYTRFCASQARKAAKTSTLFLFLALLALFSTIYCACVIFGIGFFPISTTLIAQISVVTYWASMLAVLYILVLFYRRDSKHLHYKHDEEGGSLRKDLIFLSIYLLLFAAVLVLAFYVLRNALGSDDASPYTLHFYVDTLLGMADVINENIRIV